MKIFDRLFRRKKNQETEGFQEGMEETGEQEISLDREDIDVFDEAQRSQFVESCLEQMAEASREIESLNGEYELVNSYLKDMEEVEQIKGEDKKELNEHASGIVMLSFDSKQYQGKKRVISAKDYSKMERLEAVADEGMAKIKEAEDYQNAIHQDLHRLEGEKHACLYRKHEAGVGISNIRGMAVICVCAVFACMVLLAFLQFALKMEAKVGYILTAGIAALALTVLYLKYMENVEEMKRASGSLNKVILLQNKVKIRYVNNTNLLEYLYAKYEISSGKELENLRRLYKEEKEERQRIRQVEEDLDYHQKQLIRVLKRYHLFDPIIWLHQAEALLDKKEMVEVRHNLIVRRQNLRKQMEYNTELANHASSELKELVREHPAFADEILGKVSEYEKKTKK
ncbi:MAG: hypothetical protein HDT41_04265 [Lachnospiraceae bacterium]|nr:hypothetical protein [Lachnospiraceae bacterium]